MHVYQSGTYWFKIFQQNKFILLLQAKIIQLANNYIIIKLMVFMKNLNSYILMIRWLTTWM
jgi:hypothetical protein